MSASGGGESAQSFAVYPRRRNSWAMNRDRKGISNSRSQIVAPVVAMVTERELDMGDPLLDPLVVAEIERIHCLDARMSSQTASTATNGNIGNTGNRKNISGITRPS
ncbi:hypothetical protein NXT3_CH01813 [Sinorhizobium fredii]|uniref:Uncharacterized protein n=1 Tax=Rhizobium fredii TaxID=380 RepID=A0A2L0H4F5_RHIFR|nr:hypothetical protein NXT3_CH01813 [Sinorhizobium fredii]